MGLFRRTPAQRLLRPPPYWTAVTTPSSKRSLRAGLLLRAFPGSSHLRPLDIPVCSLQMRKLSQREGHMQSLREGWASVPRWLFSWWLSGKESAYQCRRHERCSRRERCSRHERCRRHERCSFSPWVGKIPWSRKWQPTPIFLLSKSHGQRSLAGYSPWGHKELDTTEHAHITPVTESSSV